MQYLLPKGLLAASPQGQLWYGAAVPSLVRKSKTTWEKAVRSLARGPQLISGFCHSPLSGLQGQLSVLGHTCCWPWHGPADVISKPPHGDRQSWQTPDCQATLPHRPFWHWASWWWPLPPPAFGPACLCLTRPCRAAGSPAAPDTDLVSWWQATLVELHSAPNGSLLHKQ